MVISGACHLSKTYGMDLKRIAYLTVAVHTIDDIASGYLVKLTLGGSYWFFRCRHVLDGFCQH